LGLWYLHTHISALQVRHENDKIHAAAIMGSAGSGGGGGDPHSIDMRSTPQYRAFAFCDPETGRDSVTGQACGSEKLCPPQCDRGITCLFHQLMCSLGLWH
jgi:hypothetical protein